MSDTPDHAIPLVDEARQDLLAPRRRALLIAVEHRRGGLRALAGRSCAAWWPPPESFRSPRSPRSASGPASLDLPGQGARSRRPRACWLGEDLDLAVCDRASWTPAPGGRGRRGAGRAPVMDRLREIILEILRSHARTSEGRRQVELARLEYLLPRLVGRGKGMSQIAGGRMAGGMGVRGPGETALEMDRRTLRRRMVRIRHSLEEVEKRRSLERGERTSSGLRWWAGPATPTPGSPRCSTPWPARRWFRPRSAFETLDTTIRRVDLGERSEALISDTVGFLDDLPHSLIAAFRATLEETVQADLLVESWTPPTRNWNASTTPSRRC